MPGVFASLEDVRPLTPIQAGFTAYDNQIKAHIVTVSDMIRSYCRRQFDRAEYTQYAMSGRSVIRLVESPVDIDSVSIDYDPSGRYVPNGYEEFDADNNDFDADQTGLISVFAATELRSRGLRISYTGGYALKDGQPADGILQVPASLVNATAMQVAFMVQRQKAGAQGTDQEEKANTSLRKYSLGRSSGLLIEVEAMVNSYRQVLVGSS